MAGMQHAVCSSGPMLCQIAVVNLMPLESRVENRFENAHGRQCVQSTSVALQLRLDTPRIETEMHHPSSLAYGAPRSMQRHDCRLCAGRSQPAHRSLSADL